MFRRSNTLVYMFLRRIERLFCKVIDSLKLLGSKGTTGTQASFMELFDGDHAKIRKLDQMIADKMGFAGVYPVSGQTYSRKVDSRV